MTDDQGTKLAQQEENAFMGLKTFIEKICPISDYDWQQVKENAHYQTFSKHEILLNANNLSGKLWFIYNGVVRNVYLTAEGKEFNKSFILGPSFSGSMTEIITGQASRFSIEVLEDTATIIIPIKWFNQMSQSNTTFSLVALALSQQLAFKKEQREAAFLLDDASCRYQSFILEYPSIEDRIPAYHIASYLGITEVALSRIKRKLRLKY